MRSTASVSSLFVADAANVNADDAFVAVVAVVVAAAAAAAGFR